jgi:hypothetical protein
MTPAAAGDVDTPRFLRYNTAMAVRLACRRRDSRNRQSRRRKMWKMSKKMLKSPSPPHRIPKGIIENQSIFYTLAKILSKKA